MFESNVSNAGINDRVLQKYAKRMTAVVSRARESAIQGYSTEYASLALPADESLRTRVKVLAKRFRSIEALVIVGIGGSNLGTMAAQCALLGQNPGKGPGVYYVDTTDVRMLDRVISELVPAVRKGKRVLINAVSKSGTTTETIADFFVLLEMLRKARASFVDVVVTTDEGSPLQKYAEQQHFHVLPIPVNVGGRYSIMSAVGLFPLAVMGVDIDAFHAGALEARDACMSHDISQNSALQRAIVMYEHYQQKRRVANLFLWSNELYYVGAWWRQLVAESTGKEKDTRGRRVNSGILPVVSIGTTDLHSLAQLWLSRPHDALHSFVILQSSSKVSVPDKQEIDSLVRGIRGKSIVEVDDAILNGVQSTFRSKGMPFMTLTLPDASARTIGAYMQLEMMTTMYLSFLLGVNAFDQPAVEEYKSEVRRILGG